MIFTAYFNKDLRNVYDGVWQGLKQKYLPLVVEFQLVMNFSDFCRI
jgi:hypothetical protein